jgi:Amt family ammonium transporter
MKIRYIILVIVLMSFIPGWAGEEAAADSAVVASMVTAEQITSLEAAMQNNINIVWTSVAAFLVFFMQAGFALVEAGFTSAKNTVNIIMKNLMDFSVGSLMFFLIGFGLMFGVSNGFFGTTYFAFDGAVSSGTDFNWTFLIFQTVFAGTAATIVSGAMAERTKFVSYLLYSVFICAIIYPVYGSWAWGSLLSGNGWLEGMGFHDFAGSTVVHSVGGWLALAGAMRVGPRLGKYTPDGKSRAFPGHNIALASLGVFILWFGWFGFNPGSTTFGGGDIGRIAVVTNLSAAAGAIAAMFTAWIIVKKPDGSMALNGALAGLVAITAGCDVISPLGSVFVGLIGGIGVVLSVYFFEHTLKIDDPVGAISVHGVSGAVGTLLVGLLDTGSGLFYGGGTALLVTQFIGVAAGFAWAFGTGWILFFVIDKVAGLRVSEEEELRGLDIGEHGMEAYSGFQIFSTQ